MSVVIKFRVILDSEEDVFRDLELTDSSTFLELHRQILFAFNFDQSQMASFYLSNDQWEKGQEITLMKMDFDDGSSSLEMQDVSLKKMLKKKGQKLVYIYDFINMWCFFIEVLDIYISEDQKSNFPRVIYVFGEKPLESNKKLVSSPEDINLMLKNIGKNVQDSKNKNIDIFEGFDDFNQYDGDDLEDDGDEFGESMTSSKDDFSDEIDPLLENDV